MRQYRFSATLLILVILFAGLRVSFGQGPLTNALNLMVRTDSNGSLYVYGVAAGAQGPLTNLGNIRLRTYSPGSLAVTVAGGTITPDKVSLADGTAAAPSLTFASDATKGLYSPGTNGLGIATNGTLYHVFSTTDFSQRSTGRLTWSNGDPWSGTQDLILVRDAANTLAQRNGSNAQGFNIYGTYTDASNNEYLRLTANATANQIYGTKTGSGTNRDLCIGSAGSAHWCVSATTGNLFDQGTHTITAGSTVITGAGTTAVPPLTVTHGTNLTSAVADAIENDAVSFYSTVDTTNGRRADDAWNYFRLTGSGTGITTIADFFGANDGIPMVANGVYEVEWHCYFSQATAGTATWTITTATTNLANLTAEYVGSNIAGIGTVGAPQTAAVNVTGSSATAMPVTGTEATGTTHQFVIHAMMTAGNGASNTRLRLTMSAGTATPLINSFFKVRRMPAGNTGTFVS